MLIMTVVSKGTCATVPNWPFGQQPFIIGYWFSLLFAVFFLLTIVGCCWLLLGIECCLRLLIVADGYRWVLLVVIGYCIVVSGCC